MSNDSGRPQTDTTSPALRDPADWKTGDEPSTAAQRSYLTTLATEAGEPSENLDKLTKAEAAMRIEDLQRKTGRGQPKQS